MRVYLSLTPADLAADAVMPRSAWAVTDSLMASYGGDDWEQEDYEAVAMMAAGQACLEYLDGVTPACRIVAAADCAEAVAFGPAAGQVSIDGPVSLADVVSFHIDEEESWPIVAAAAAGEDDEDALSETALLWYDVSEIALVRDILNAG
ncbi:hypothetical protein H8R18_01940 [Nanchangia anserum]|uniref:Uncharacterized protein n=1 Tax=Nanchangia anserum TaxID=2692125 RepID=A0A8I0G8V4_9ACTO|nr:hypothetical protein [Nanchangia anserum]MBD3690060.1 hypothetical protein [Nanchangia anserum]QOX82146.1 hypothetical protein H8R18_01940 [Nanchangia anserum]